jgi:hypothetical protein
MHRIHTICLATILTTGMALWLTPEAHADVRAEAYFLTTDFPQTTCTMSGACKSKKQSRLQTDNATCKHPNHILISTNYYQMAPKKKKVTSLQFVNALGTGDPITPVRRVVTCSDPTELLQNMKPARHTKEAPLKASFYVIYQDFPDLQCHWNTCFLTEPVELDSSSIKLKCAEDTHEYITSSNTALDASGKPQGSHLVSTSPPWPKDYAFETLTIRAKTLCMDTSVALKETSSVAGTANTCKAATHHGAQEQGNGVYADEPDPDIQCNDTTCYVPYSIGQSAHGSKCQTWYNKSIANSYYHTSVTPPVKVDLVTLYPGDTIPADVLPTVTDNSNIRIITFCGTFGCGLPK